MILAIFTPEEQNNIKFYIHAITNCNSVTNCILQECSVGWV